MSPSRSTPAPTRFRPQRGRRDDYPPPEWLFDEPTDVEYSDTCWDCGASVDRPHMQTDYGRCDGYWAIFHEGRHQYIRKAAR